MRDGIAELLCDAPDFVRAESDGLQRFAAVMRADGWDRDRIRTLPDVDLPYWHGQRQAMERLLARVPFRPGERLLDVGSNTCLASIIFAARGLVVVALDISLDELQGLRTADYFLDGGEVYFERVQSVMFGPALASACMDHVFCCEVLHHNDPVNLRRTFGELYRVLRPGGRLFVVNEPMRFPLLRKRDHAEEIAEFSGYEHVYYFHQYWLAARRAGFAVRLAVPGWSGTSTAPVGDGAARVALRRGRILWRCLVTGDLPLSLDCVKPRRRARRSRPRSSSPRAG